jgi:hypothetical protein
MIGKDVDRCGLGLMKGTQPQQLPEGNEENHEKPQTG